MWLFYMSWREHVIDGQTLTMPVKICLVKRLTWIALFMHENVALPHKKYSVSTWKDRKEIIFKIYIFEMEIYPFHFYAYMLWFDQL